MSKIKVRPLTGAKRMGYEEAVTKAKVCWKLVGEFLDAKAAGDINRMLKARLAIGRAVPPGVYRRGDDSNDGVLYAVLGPRYRNKIMDPDIAFEVSMVEIGSDNGIQSMFLMGSEGFITPVRCDGPGGQRFVRIGEVRSWYKHAA